MPKKIDYLTEDTEIPNQKYVVLSILSPGFNKSLDKYDIRGIKIRGVYATYEEAMERCKYLQGADPLHNVFIGEVGKWCPFVDDPEKAKDSQYAEAKLQTLMKSYLENQVKAKQLYEARKNEMMMQSMAQQLTDDKKKKKNKNKNKKKVTTDGVNMASSDLVSNDLNIDISSLPSAQINTPDNTSNDVKLLLDNETLSNESNDDNDQNDEITELEAEINRVKLQLMMEEQKTKINKSEDIDTINNLREIANDMHSHIAGKQM
jgi:hypothetical protein